MNKYKYSFDLGAFFGSEEKETRLKEAPAVETSILPRPKQKQEAVQEVKPEYDPYGFIPDFAAAYKGAGGVPPVGSDLPLPVGPDRARQEVIDNVLNDLQRASATPALNLEPPVIAEREEEASPVDAEAIQSAVEVALSEDAAPVTTEEVTTTEATTGGTGLMSRKVEASDDPTQKLLDRIAYGEGADPKKLKAQAKHGIGTTEYDMVYAYGNVLAPDKPVTSMTMTELESYQNKLISATKGKIPGTKYGTSAVGKYQVIKTSLFGKGGTAKNPRKNSWADKLGLKEDTVYTPEIQEKIGFLALKEAGYDSYINGDRSQNSFQDRIANIWASVAKADGSDRYGQGVHTFKEDMLPMFKALAPATNDKPAPKESVRPKLRPEKTEE